MAGVLIAILIFVIGEWLAYLFWKKASDKLSALGTLAGVSLLASAFLSIPLSRVKVLVGFAGEVVRFISGNPETLHDFLIQFEILAKVDKAGLPLDLALMLFALFWLIFG